MQALWPDVAVTDNAITQVVSDLRQALGDNTASPQFVQTVPRRGYRFVAAVEVVEAPAPAPTPVRAATAAAGQRRGPRVIAVMDFTNVTSDPQVAWLASGIAETVTNDLRAIEDLAVLDRASSPRRGGAGRRGRSAVTPDLIVVGSYQRSGDQLRITARVVDVATREAVVHAKADGAIEDVFDLQDAIVTQLGAGLRLRISPAAQARISTRETSSLEAYRALTLGRLKLEALDPDQIPAAIADFERALGLDSRYALAHVGLAHARFWRLPGVAGADRSRIAPRSPRRSRTRNAPSICSPISRKRTPRSGSSSPAPTAAPRPSPPAAAPSSSSPATGATSSASAWPRGATNACAGSTPSSRSSRCWPTPTSAWRWSTSRAARRASPRASCSPAWPSPIGRMRRPIAFRERPALAARRDPPCRRRRGDREERVRARAAGAGQPAVCARVRARRL